MRQPLQKRSILLRNEKLRQLAHSVLDSVPIDSDKPVEFRVSEFHEKRSNIQNNLMWAELENISKAVAKNCNIAYTSKSWHIFFNQEFLPEHHIDGITKDGYEKWEYLPNGNRNCIGSTTQLTKRGFSDYMEEIYAYVAGLGVEL